MTPWYEISFGEDYLLVYKHRSQQEADEQIAAILPLLELKPDSKILDLCCGTGRHALALAKRGYPVTGLDLSEILLKYARREGQNYPVKYIRGDMRALPFADRSFDVVLNLFTSFGYFVEERENEQVLREISRVLVANGRYLIDFLNRDYVQNRLKPYTEREQNGLVIREERAIDGVYVKKTITVIDGGESRQYYEQVRMDTREEMEAMIKWAGLKVECVMGDYTGEPYGKETPRMMFFGRKEVA